MLEATFAKLDASANNRIKPLYLTCRTSNDHLNLTRQIKAFLETRNVKITRYSEPEGMQHVWAFQRPQPVDFASLLFRPAGKQ